jgi:hypothetical protein
MPGSSTKRHELQEASPRFTECACAECGWQPRDDENPADEWRAYLDVDDDLPVFSPACAEREFGN